MWLWVRVNHQIFSKIQMMKRKDQKDQQHRHYLSSWASLPKPPLYDPNHRLLMIRKIGRNNSASISFMIQKTKKEQVRKWKLQEKQLGIDEVFLIAVEKVTKISSRLIKHKKKNVASYLPSFLDSLIEKKCTKRLHLLHQHCWITEQRSVARESFPSYFR